MKTLPWSTGREFQLWRYGVGHSQLLLRSVGSVGQQTLGILFEAVEFVRLRRTYADLVLRLARDDESEAFDEVRSLPIPQLFLVLEGRDRLGLVACSRVTVRSTDDPENDSWADGDRVFSVSSRS